MLKRSKSPVTPGESVFFRPLSVVLKVKSGNLYKSPPQYAMKTEKSWKKRFFVLFKISEGHHQLMYFRSSDDEGQKPLGEIELSRVSLLHRNPQHQPKWEWIQKTFKCSPDHVVYIKTERRDYFLRGETSEEMDSWFSVLLDALKDRPFRFLSVEEVSNGEHTVEAISGPMVKKKNPPELKKIRSLSVPDVHYNTREEAMDARRPVSYPSKSNRFAHPPLCTVPILEENKPKNNESSELLYETMENLQLNEDTNTATEKKPRSSASSCSSTTSSSMENSSDFVAVAFVEKDIEMSTADLKKHLTLVDKNGKLRVSSWTGVQQQTLGLFLKGDLILAVNDLRAVNLDEFNMFVSKSLKDKVKVTILRPSGGDLHSRNSACNS
ncbi:pleckstrin homology domain-containing family S member 1 isoform X2 [Oryzias latipes]|uniref:pleckstrin homology domain-containing family S member 1 isoform X2 n=1 Tax=Oryzias latipes TaxID=8090 RepID=UPI000CE1ED95|nr:pleckstrin homology domain-containing family S member 1 isoform X2 [Oryzias latipes]